MASSAAILRRLAGLETEYAIRYEDGGSNPSLRPTDGDLFARIIASLGENSLLAEAYHEKSGYFMANGGAVFFETQFASKRHGLLEGATPECRGPRQIVAFQRAQDELFGQAALAAHHSTPCCLIKNDCDSRGNVYGAQENYEATIASGMGLWVWRFGLLGLWPLALLSWSVIIGLLLIGLVVVGLFSGCVLWPLRQVTRGRWKRAHRRLSNMQQALGKEPVYDEPLAWAVRLAFGPLAAAMSLLAWMSAFRSTRRALIPFLISRPVLSGAGFVEPGGAYCLSGKALSRNCLLGLGSFLLDRPIFSVGHFFKAASFDFLRPSEYKSLFRRRQRLQICLGDSNMAQIAEYLRVGTTMLVLDAIEAGAIKRPPRVFRPIAALRRVCRDPSLGAIAGRCQGAAVNCLDLQRFYLDSCRRFVASNSDAADEAHDILRLWEQTLNTLEQDPQSLVGRVDWLTKRFLLQQGGDLPYPQQKKIDIRYHELSPEGYFQRLATSGIATSIVSEAEIDRAKRNPPADTPATNRGRYIREFSGGGEPLRVGWQWLFIGKGRKRRISLGE